MKYSKKQFLEDVAKEATALKEHATSKELRKLDFTKFNPFFRQRCIYGLATGDCNSERACELITLCCKRYFRNESDIETYGLDAIKNNVNGRKIEGISNSYDFRTRKRVFGIKYYSSIEAYIQLPDAQNENLIAFLKGETEDLKL